MRLFIEQGFQNTTPKEILSEANVTPSTFYNIYRSKSAILNELTEFMFENQFSMAEKITGGSAQPILLYAVETCIQLTLTELNENLREIYVEAYTQPDTVGIIQRSTAKTLERIFRPYLPNHSPSDFFELDIGTSALMRGYMAHPCDMYFTLERKLERFLQMTLSIYAVPVEEQKQVIAFVAGLDIRSIADQVMQKLFSALAMKFDFQLSVPE